MAFLGSLRFAGRLRLPVRPFSSWTCRATGPGAEALREQHDNLSLSLTRSLAMEAAADSPSRQSQASSDSGDLAAVLAAELDGGSSVDEAAEVS